MLEPKNAGIREKLRKAFVWYDQANNEHNKDRCNRAIELADGMLIKDHDAPRYQADFAGKTALRAENGGG